MPRNLYRKNWRQQKLSNKDSATELLPGQNKNKAHKQKKWWATGDIETIPRFGQRIVSSPQSPLSSQKHKYRLIHSLLPHQRDQMLASGGPGKPHHKSKKLRLFQPKFRAMMISSSEIKEYLLQAVEIGKRKMDDWIISEFEEVSSPEKDIIIWESCGMDWQPEKTIVIPQAVNVQYPWDPAGETGKEQWRRKKSGRDAMMEGIS